MKGKANQSKTARKFLRGSVNKQAGKWESLEKNDLRLEEGGGAVVKGTSRRIIVVKSPDPKIFEQAIFIVREDYAGQAGVTDREVLRQARQVACGYLQLRNRQPGKLPSHLRGVMYAAAGSAATVLAWIMLQMVRL